MFASGSSCADAAADVRAVHPRHHPVENRQRRLGRDAQPVPRLRAVADERRAVAPPLKRPRQDLAGHAIVFGDQDLHRSSEYTMSAAGRDATDAARYMNRAFVRRLGLAVLCGAAGLRRQCAAARRGRAAAARPRPHAADRDPVRTVAGRAGGARSARCRFAATSAPRCSRSLPAEALLVGAFAQRGKSPLVAGALVWGVAALSLVAAPSLYGVGYLRADRSGRSRCRRC